MRPTTWKNVTKIYRFESCSWPGDSGPSRRIQPMKNKFTDKQIERAMKVFELIAEKCPEVTVQDLFLAAYAAAVSLGNSKDSK
jgi:hypothetical protein